MSETTLQDHLSTEESHATSVKYHMTTEESHVTSGEYHMTTEESHVTSGESHVTSGEDHVTSNNEEDCTIDHGRIDRSVSVEVCVSEVEEHTVSVAVSQVS